MDTYLAIALPLAVEQSGKRVIQVGAIDLNRAGYGDDYVSPTSVRGLHQHRLWLEQQPDDDDQEPFRELMRYIAPQRLRH